MDPATHSFTAPSSKQLWCPHYKQRQSVQRVCRVFLFRSVTPRSPPVVRWLGNWHLGRCPARVLLISIDFLLCHSLVGGWRPLQIHRLQKEMAGS